MEFFEKSNLAFKHLLLKDWDPAYETMPYPPATGKYAIYNLGYLYQHMNFAMEHVSFKTIWFLSNETLQVLVFFRIGKAHKLT